MPSIVQGSHFRLPMRIADQSVYLTFHLCNANICFFSKDSVPVHTQSHYINISQFHMPRNSYCFQVFEFLTIWDLCNRSFNVFAYNFTLWRSHQNCSNQNSGVGHVDSFQFFYFILKEVVVQLLLQEEFQEWKCWTKCSTHWNFWSILPTCDLKRLYNFTFLPVVFAYLYTQTHLKSSFLKHLSFAYT